MNKPKMILFDYGQTLANEKKFDGIAGTKALLEYAEENRFDLTPEQVQEEADKINNEIGRFDPERNHLFQIEIPNNMFTNYFYSSLGIKLSPALSHDDIDRIFWDASSPAKPTEGIVKLLLYLKDLHIRTGVISNISYSGNVVAKRINTLLPDNSFEFIIATSEYMFRKPNRRIFDLALIKAGLEAGDVWYIGDNFECDIVGAHNAGMTPVLYDGASEKRSGKPADFEYLHIHHWDELINVLKDLNEMLPPMV
ncbi:MAG: HAD-IA family hydrolase [Oscillospiraceae bacterium]|nr:HAD-IA family hydrolase [Oscillospiraceae bacterium]